MENEKRNCKSCGQIVALEMRNCPNCNSLMDAPTASPESVTVPCKFCGEGILKFARKCRFCGEYQSESDREVSQNLRDVTSDADESLTGSEVLFGVLCSGIACIVSIVWIIQGKGKGWKLFLISLAAQAVFTAIRVAVGLR